MRPNPVQQIGIPNKRYPMGFCYVMIPENVDRDKYVKQCYRTGRVAVLMDDGSFLLNVPIGLSILQNIDFPTETRKLGSQLVWINHHVHNAPIIIDRILKDDEAIDLDEHEFKLQKYTENGSVSISGKAEDGNLFINVEGKNSNGGKIYIDVSNEDEEGGVILNLKGDLRAELKNLIYNILEDANIVSKGDININPTEDGKKVNLGTGDEPILKGDETVDQLEIAQDYVELLQSATKGIATALDALVSGTSTAFESAMTAGIKPDYKNSKSEKSFTQ
jgi:hypothetical protein